MREAALLLTAFLLQLTSTPAIRVFSGSALGLLTQGDDSTAIKRSWPTAIEPGLYKVKLTQRGYIQFLRYMVNVPPLQQYTFCLWVNSANFTYDHPLFSYSRDEKESMVKVWLSPKDKSLKITVKDQPVLKVPLQLREGKWHHFCQSWSGVTGEWHVFVDGVLKAHEKFPRHVGVMLPGGGDIAVGQELTDFNKGLDDGIEGEIFGFNMVDEAVDLQELGQIKGERLANYRADDDKSHTTPIPEFKKMPNSRKTFEEIQGFISKLPAIPSSATPAKMERIRVGELPASSQPKTNAQVVKVPLQRVVYREGRKNERRPERPDRPKENRNQPRPVPLKVIETSRATNKPRQRINQVYNENYNMHTYKGAHSHGPKDVPYKTFEVQEEDNVIEKRIGVIGNDNNKRKRMNFDVASAWEANKAHPFYKNKINNDFSRRQYHFESNQQQTASRRNFIVEPYDDKVDHVKLRNRVSSSLPSAIPVNEVIDEGYRRRRRRSTSRTSRRGSRQSSGGEFRPLPALPEEFSELLNPTTKNEAVLEKLSAFINSRSNSSQIARNVPKFLLKKDPQFFPSAEDALLIEHNVHVPEVSQALIESRISIPMKAGTAGNDLVKSSFSNCAALRGSPMADQRHVLISWADTPVRMYGGAVVANAKAVCAHF